MKTTTLPLAAHLLFATFALLNTSVAKAAYQNATLANGLLTITSTPTASMINLKVNGANLAIEEIPSLNDPAVIRASFPLASVRRIKYIGGAGIDIFTAANLNIPILALGNDGNDILSGGNKNDVLIGGKGTDSMLGRGGDDILVGIDGALGDNLVGDVGKDAFWMDFIGGNRDQNDRQADDYMHDVARFANGADLTLDGDNIADPALNTQFTSGWAYANHRDKPLFPSNGPSLSDIRQRLSSDCKVVATIAGLANNTVSGSAWPVRRALADFGDGTFGVRLGNNFYRVDGDLPMNGGNFGSSAPGAENCIWPAIIEKALCYHLPRTPGVFQWQDLFSIAPHDILLAFGAQEASSPLIGERYSSAQDLANKLFSSFNNYENVVFTLALSSTVGGVHAYTLTGVTRNASGAVTAITFYNPWGNSDGNGRNANGTQWYTDANPNDARVTFTPAQLWQDANIGRATVGSRIQ
jgi:hypothetical protein